MESSRSRFAGFRQQQAATAHLDAVDDLRGIAEVEVEEDRQQAHAVGQGGVEDGVHVPKERSVWPQRIAAGVEANAGPQVAQQEQAQDGHTVGGQSIDDGVEPGQRVGPRPKAAVGEPGARAEVAAVVDPRQVGAKDEPLRGPRPSFHGLGLSARSAMRVNDRPPSGRRTGLPQPFHSARDAGSVVQKRGNLVACPRHV